MSTPNLATSIEEIADGIFQITTRMPDLMPGGFTFNQFLIVDDEPLLFHTGMRGLFELVRGAVANVIAPERIRYLAYSHLEADECGSLNQWLAVAKEAVPLCSNIGSFVFLADSADRPAKGLANGERLSLGKRTVRWIDAPHVPHGEDCGYLFDEKTRTLFCGDLFAQPGSDTPIVTEGDIWGPSEMFRERFPYAPVRNASALVGEIAKTEPALLACMHGASYRGNGGSLLQSLAKGLEG